MSGNNIQIFHSVRTLANFAPNGTELMHSTVSFFNNLEIYVKVIENEKKIIELLWRIAIDSTSSHRRLPSIMHSFSLKLNVT